MFKKILLFTIILSPVWFSFFVGYPVISSEKMHVMQKEHPNISISKRCFNVGDFGQFTECFKRSERINGRELLQSVTEKTNQISPIIKVLLFVCLLLFIIASVILIWSIL